MTATAARASRSGGQRRTFRATAEAAAPSKAPAAAGNAAACPDDPHAALWERYLATRGKVEFDALVAVYRPYVETVAARFVRRLPPSVDIDDVVSAGCFGLMDAIGVFDPSRNTRFQTFALKRIVGAMNDYLRAQDIAPRLARRREAQVKRARDDFRKRHGRSPTEEELLRLLNPDEQEALAIVAGAEIPSIASLTGPSDDGETGVLLERLPVGGHAGRSGISAADTFSRSGAVDASFGQEIQRWLGRALSRSERLIIWLYYFESLTMKEIGQVLGICEGRVSQIHALLLERLRARLTRDGDGRRAERS